MTSLPFYEQVLIIAICAGATILTRLLPFLIFKPGSRLPGYVNFLGKALPSAVFALLVIYCLKDVQWTGGNYGIPEIAETEPSKTGADHKKIWVSEDLSDWNLGTMCDDAWKK